MVVDGETQGRSGHQNKVGIPPLQAKEQEKEEEEKVILPLYILI
jgi:hypothetical protein